MCTFLPFFSMAPNIELYVKQTLSKILLTHLIFVTTCEGNFLKVCLLKASLKLFFLKHRGIQTSPYLALNSKANLTLIPIFKYLSKR